MPDRNVRAADFVGGEESALFLEQILRVSDVRFNLLYSLSHWQSTIKNLAWCAAVTERLVEIAIEWHSQVYAHLNHFSITPWTFGRILELADSMKVFLGSVRSGEDLKALVRRTQEICPHSFVPAASHTVAGTTHKTVQWV